MLGGPKEEEARRVLRKVKIASLKVVVGLPTQKRVQAVISTRTKAEARNEEEWRKNVLVLNLVSQPSNHPVKRRIVSPGNQTIGMMILLFHLLYVVQLHGMARDLQLGRHHSLCTSPTIPHMLFRILVAHSRLDREQPSEASRNMHCTMALRRIFAIVISPLCLPTLTQRLVLKVVLFILRQHLHVLPELTYLRRATCLSYSLLPR